MATRWVNQWGTKPWDPGAWGAGGGGGKATGPAKGLPPGNAPLPPPPVGTYDPAIDYNAAGSDRGYQNTFDDARTAYEQGQEDFGLGVGDITRNRDRSLTDLLTSRTRLKEDVNTQREDNSRQYGILGNQQGEAAARQGVTSAGLLGKSNQVRGANEARDRGRIDLAGQRGLSDIDLNRTRVGEDFDRGMLGLNLGNARAFGGAFGNTILNPLTGKPQIGSLVTGLTRAGTENNAFQNFSAGQRTSQAAGNGYIAPGLLPTSTPNPGLLDRFKTARRARIT